MKDVSWDDLRLFLHVADQGGLSAAARETGVSAPTLGRRMLVIEQQMGRTLFHRTQGGYRLTPDGNALLTRVRAMQAAANPVEEFVTRQSESPVLRISAGTATATFLAAHMDRLCFPGDRFRINFVTTERVLDIAHREIDLGIRNRPPEAGNLASRPLGTLRFAPYRAIGAAEAPVLGWVGLDPEHAIHPAATWLHEQGHPIRVLASSVATVHELVRAGAGIGVMPCLMADRDPGLVRAGPLIDALTETQHLVMHNDDRHRPEMRRLIDRIVALYQDSAALIGGARPINGMSDAGAENFSAAAKKTS